MPPTPAAPSKTASQCLANKIMALREHRCDTHKHYLCDLCGGEWIDNALDASLGELEEMLWKARRLLWQHGLDLAVKEIDTTLAQLPWREETR